MSWARCMRNSGCCQRWAACRRRARGGGGRHTPTAHARHVALHGRSGRSPAATASTLTAWMGHGAAGLPTPPCPGLLHRPGAPRPRAALVARSLCSWILPVPRLSLPQESLCAAISERLHRTARLALWRRITHTNKRDRRDAPRCRPCYGHASCCWAIREPSNRWNPASLAPTAALPLYTKH